MIKKVAVILVIVAALVVVTACSGGRDGGTAGYDPELVAAGETLYAQTCFTCHGLDAKGMPNLGRDLTTSEFFADRTDQEILAYVQEGRPADDPSNISGIAMPPKGGFNFLTDDDILAIIAYLRTLQE